MQESRDLPLKELAVYAVQHSIRGTSIKPNSLLKPLDIILQELDRCPNPDDKMELELIRAAVKALIFDHLKRIAKDEYKPGKTKQSKINEYVDLFFDEVLEKAHNGKINKLLSRERLLRAAYLFWVREARAERSVSSGKAKDIKEATDELQSLEETVENGIDEEDAE